MPQSGVVGGNPPPRKHNPAPVRMASAAFTEKMIATDGMTFGYTYRLRITRALAPRLRAASTYSDSLTDNVWPGTIRKYVGMYRTAIATMTLKMLGPRTAVMAMARIRPGNAYRLSISTVRARSIFPPVNPANKPRGTPLNRDTRDEEKPMISAIRVPQISRLRTSWPN